METAMMIADNSVNLDDRILYLSADVNATSIADICKQILAIEEVDRKGLEKFRNYTINPIRLYVQSFGGSIYDMWSLIDIIEASQTPIITYCTGYCMSAAALIFLAGHIRVMYKHSTIMFHQMTAGYWAKFNDIQIEQKQLESMHKDMMKCIRKKTNLKDKFFKRIDDNKEDVYFTAKECIKHGICDKIAEKSDLRDVMLEQLNASSDSEDNRDCCE